MPVVTVAVAPHPAVPELVDRLAESIAAVLDLGPGDVIVAALATGATALSGGSRRPSSPWPIVSIHGSRRPDPAVAAARRASEQAVRAWCESHGIECEGVWTEWLTPSS